MPDRLSRIENAGPEEQQELIHQCAANLGESKPAHWWGRLYKMLEAEAFLDAALMVVREVRPGWWISLREDQSLFSAMLRAPYDYRDTGPAAGTSIEPALALLSALIRSMGEEGK